MTNPEKIGEIKLNPDMFKKIECKTSLSEEDIKTSMVLLDLKNVTISGNKNIDEEETKMKSNMLGNVHDYQKIYDTLKICQENLDSVGMGLSEAIYHGWEGEPLKNEYKIYKNVKFAYQEFMKALSEAIGSEQTG